MIEYDGEYGLKYRCTSCGHVEKADLRTSKEIKLGWRVDWPMRWQYEHTVFEPAGKDHHSQGGSFDTARLVADEVYHWPAPVSFRYDFIGIKGGAGKMSSSSGNVTTLSDVLSVYPPEIVRYLFAGTRPDTEFTISFDLDVIKTYEDYDKTERIVWGVDKAKNENIFAKEKRIYELSQVDKMPEEMPYQVTGGFRHLCNLLQINGGDIDAVIAVLPDVKPSQEKALRRRAKCAWYWITECARRNSVLRSKSQMLRITKKPSFLRRNLQLSREFAARFFLSLMLLRKSLFLKKYTTLRNSARLSQKSFSRLHTARSSVRIRDRVLQAL